MVSARHPKERMEPMNIKVTGRRITVTDSLRDYAIGLAASKIAGAVLRDEQRVLTIA